MTMKNEQHSEQPAIPPLPPAPGSASPRRILEAVEDRFDEMENAALHAWNRLDSDDPERPYHEGFLAAVKYVRREYRRTLSAAMFEK